MRGGTPLFLAMSHGLCFFLINPADNYLHYMDEKKRGQLFLALPLPAFSSPCDVHLPHEGRTSFPRCYIVFLFFSPVSITPQITISITKMQEGDKWKQIKMVHKLCQEKLNRTRQKHRLQPMPHPYTPYTHTPRNNHIQTHTCNVWSTISRYLKESVGYSVHN